MSKRNDAAEPFFSMGEKLCALGEALKDKRTRIDEIAGLAYEAGMRIEFRVAIPDQTEAEC